LYIKLLVIVFVYRGDVMYVGT